MKNYLKNNTFAVVVAAVLLAGGAIAVGSLIEKQAEPKSHEMQVQAVSDQNRQ